jgi:phospholipid/cholesterol/gamma-HCH transport system permease protein
MSMSSTNESVLQNSTDQESDPRGPLSAPRVEVADVDGRTRIQLAGDWQLHGVASIDSDMRQFGESIRGTSATIDFSQLGRLDTSGALLVERLRIRLEQRGVNVEYQSVSEDRATLLEAVGKALRVEYSDDDEAVPVPSLAERVLDPIGRATYLFRDDFAAALFILGSAVRGAQVKLNRASGISAAAIVSQMDHMGVRAVPIICLMSFLIGGIIAQQGAFQLRYFGAELFVVDLVGILQLREIGVLLTAIMIAGRSGSAITAEIGSMKMREEVDALKVMGLNPVGVLVFPRLVALTVMLPALTVVANFSALFGACMTTWVYSDITPETFISRLREAIDMSTIVSGMIKAPFMALIIGIVSSVEGLKVGGSAESLGRHVTSAVVKAIFVVILVDGLFAIFYGAIDF